MAIKHSFVSEKADGSDQTLVKPSDWNASHTGLPDTIANVLSDHTKANHDSLGIDADTVDSSHASEFATSVHTHSHTALTDIGTNTHAQIDTAITNLIETTKTATGWDIKFNTVKIAEIDENGNLKLKGEISVLQSF